MRRIIDGRSRLQFPPPMWKVKRELNRMYRQMDDLILRLTGFSLARAYVKLMVTPRTTQDRGGIALGDRAAIYMIYPAQGLLQSHLIALDYIVACGYAPIVVSNLPLDAAAKATVLQKSAALITRPNFGYDFAAYGAALKYLQGIGADLEYLAIFNDSTWFPAQPHHNWLAEAEATGCDFVGSVCHNGIDPISNPDFTRDPWQPDPYFHWFHYGSFALLIRRAALTSAAFQRFWQEYRPTNDKPITILRGEIGLTRTLVDAGFSHTATLDTMHLDQTLAALPYDDLLALAKNTIVPTNKPLKSGRLSLFATPRPDRDLLTNFILTAVIKEGPGYALAHLDVGRRTGNFIKKSPVTLDRITADQTLDLLASLPDPRAAVFLQEARALQARTHTPAD